jgi:5-methylcytosine-specific restriction endonuclease McrA
VGKVIKRRGRVAYWEIKFKKILQKHHGNFAKKIFHRLMKKSATLKSSLKQRSKEYEVDCTITLDEIRDLFIRSYGKECVFCTDILLVSNIVCDHRYPISLGGSSTVSNLSIICRRCNTRKGHLTENEYKSLLKYLSKKSKNMKAYVLRKLAKGDNFE